MVFFLLVCVWLLVFADSCSAKHNQCADWTAIGGICAAGLQLQNGSFSGSACAFVVNTVVGGFQNCANAYGWYVS